ncbi:hypothetical protein [Microbulbifer sp. SAOS-129_SWC]|uniref:hypothetical protein n=1 Tax=Microbulbifer sp. SAOS-129_SWC TaxID=3145235 RepID=UPI00321790BE
MTNSAEQILLDKFKSEKEKGEYLHRRLCVSYAKVYMFRRSLLGRLIGHIERIIRYVTFRPSSKSELTQLYEAALQYQQERGIDFQVVMNEYT